MLPGSFQRSKWQEELHQREGFVWDSFPLSWSPEMISILVIQSLMVTESGDCILYFLNYYLQPPWLGQGSGTPRMLLGLPGLPTTLPFLAPWSLGVQCVVLPPDLWPSHMSSSTQGQIIFTSYSSAQASFRSWRLPWPPVCLPCFCCWPLTPALSFSALYSCLLACLSVWSFQ